MLVLSKDESAKLKFDYGVSMAISHLGIPQRFERCYKQAFAGEIAEATTECSRSIEKVRRKGNMTSRLGSLDEDRCISSNLKSRILGDVKEKLNAVSRKMKLEISNRCSAMNASMWKVGVFVL